MMGKRGLDYSAVSAMLKEMYPAKKLRWYKRNQFVEIIKRIKRKGQKTIDGWLVPQFETSEKPLGIQPRWYKRLYRWLHKRVKK